MADKTTVILVSCYCKSTADGQMSMVFRPAGDPKYHLNCSVSQGASSCPFHILIIDLLLFLNQSSVNFSDPCHLSV